MARYIDLSDKAKAAVQLSEARKFDHEGTLAEILARVELVKASGAPERKVERRLAALRVEYAAALRYKRFAETGVNELHLNLIG
jgi:hypothetical protein